MGLDERSRRQLEELGRRLPQPLPQPAPAPSPAAGSSAAKRHAIETETDPQQLFHQLMQASPDGSVPPHLLDRLKQLELSQPSRVEQPADAKGRRRGPGQRQSTPAAGHDPLYVVFEQMLLEDDEASEA
ncbi:MAG: hypothetical protein VKM98_02870 [Cyanobacteriota bacterium]|nr:hypothetical protein [Cyanobacteriota bacterium]